MVSFFQEQNDYSSGPATEGSELAVRDSSGHDTEESTVTARSGPGRDGHGQPVPLVP